MGVNCMIDCGIWSDDGSAITVSEAVAMVKANLEYLSKDDPAYTEQVELLEVLYHDYY